MADLKQVTIAPQKGKDTRVGALGLADGRLALGNPGLAIDTNFDVQNGNAFDVVVGGLFYTISSGQTFDTGTSKNLSADTWGAALLSVDNDGTTYLQWASGDYATEAAAIGGLDAVTPTGEVVVGYVTVLTADSSEWDAGTDALQGGSGGDVSADTNYYNACGWVL